MEEEEEIKISLDATQLRLIADSLSGRHEAMKKKNIKDWFTNDRLIPSVIKLTEPERLKEKTMRKNISSFLNMVDSRKLFVTEDDWLTTVNSVSSHPFNEFQAPFLALQKKVRQKQETLIEEYDEFVMDLLHQKGFFNKDEERKA